MTPPGVSPSMKMTPDPHGPDVPSTRNQSESAPETASRLPEAPITAALLDDQPEPRAGRRSSSVRRPETSWIVIELVRFPAEPGAGPRTSLSFNIEPLGGTDQYSMNCVFPS